VGGGDSALGRRETAHGGTPPSRPITRACEPQASPQRGLTAPKLGPKSRELLGSWQPPPWHPLANSFPKFPFSRAPVRARAFFLFKGAHEHPSMARYRNIFEARAADPNPETVSAPPTPTASESGAPAVQGLFCWVNARWGAGLRGPGKFSRLSKVPGAALLGGPRRVFSQTRESADPNRSGSTGLPTMCTRPSQGWFDRATKHRSAQRMRFLGPRDAWAAAGFTDTLLK